jgi:hypothetical protein
VLCASLRAAIRVDQFTTSASATDLKAQVTKVGVTFNVSDLVKMSSRGRATSMSFLGERIWDMGEFSLGIGFAASGYQRLNRGTSR